MSLKDDIGRADDSKREAVDMSEFWPGVQGLCISKLTSWDSFTYSQQFDKATDLFSHLLVRCITDGNGERVFTDDDVALLGKKSPEALKKLYEIAVRINKLGKQDQDDIEKNSASRGAAS